MKLTAIAQRVAACFLFLWLHTRPSPQLFHSRSFSARTFTEYRLKTPCKARSSFYSDAEPVAPPDHPDHPDDEVQPYAKQNGGVDDTLAPPRLYLYGPAASPWARQFIVDGSGWYELPDGASERGELISKVLSVLRKNGFVVVEGLLPPLEQLSMENAAIQHFNSLPVGYFSSPLRANRSQVPVPYEDPWSADWLTKNDFVLQVAAKYVFNNMACGRNEEEQQEAWCRWVTEGSNLEWFESVFPKPGFLAQSPANGCTTVGRPDALGPWLGKVYITKTPGMSPLMTKHRDIVLPGPCAQLTVAVPLTPLVGNNGPLGLRPGSHIMQTPGYEVVANIPHGSVLLYDSFLDHRAVEHHLARDRYVLYYEFETRGIFTGFMQGHFGKAASKSEDLFRNAVDPVLRRHVDSALRRTG